MRKLTENDIVNIMTALLHAASMLRSDVPNNVLAQEMDELYDLITNSDVYVEVRE